MIKFFIMLRNLIIIIFLLIFKYANYYYYKIIKIPNSKRKVKIIIWKKHFYLKF